MPRIAQDLATMVPFQSAARETVLCVAIFATGILAGSRAAPGEDFRVENEVFFNHRKTPASRSTTIFHDEMVYDYLGDPAEVIVFDKKGGRFVLLDTARRVRTELTTQEVLDFTRRLQQRAAAQDDPFLKFLAAPRFDEEFDRASAELTLSSPWMVYRLVLVAAESPAIARQYREFCDWYARLNTLLNPGAKPPLARLAVNAAMAKREAVAREVRLTIMPEQKFPPKRISVRSTHRLVRRLAEADLDLVAQTQQFTEIYKPLDFDRYRRRDPP